MKLVAWVGGPEVVEFGEYPGEFFCVKMSNDEFHRFVVVSHEISDDLTCFLPLEVDE